MHRLLYLLFLFAVVGASAQKMPERREVRKGNRSYNRSDYKTAIERYTRALTYAPDSFEATYDLGNALYKAEMLDKAEQTMARAAADTLRTDEERAESFYNLGNAQFRQKKYKEALESYRRSLLFDPTDMEAKYNYAYTKKLLEENQDQNGGNDDQQQNQDKDQNQRDQQEKQQDNQQDEKQDNGNEQQDGEQNPSEPEQGDDGNPRDLPGG